MVAGSGLPCAATGRIGPPCATTGEEGEVKPALLEKGRGALPSWRPCSRPWPPEKAMVTLLVVVAPLVEGAARIAGALSESHPAGEAPTVPAIWTRTPPHRERERAASPLSA